MGVPLELAEYGRAIARGWWILLVCLLAGLGAAALVTARTAPVYQSNIKFFAVTPSAAGQSTLQAQELSRNRITSYANLVKSEGFLGRLVRDSGTGISGKDLADSVGASADRDTLTLSVIVSQPEQAKAFAIARSIANNLGSAAGELDTGGAVTNLTVVAGPTNDPAPVSPKVPLNLAVGALLGLAAGIAIPVARRLSDKSLRTAQEVEDASGLPVLARIPLSTAVRPPARILDQSRGTLLDEAGRRLRTNIDHFPAMGTAGVVAVTAAGSGEGSTSVALMLARAWAEAGERVLLVEAGLRSPRLAADLGLGAGTGLTDVLSGRLPLDQVIQHTAVDGLHAVAAGAVPPNPTELLGSRALPAALQELRGSYARVVVDAPAMEPYSDAAVIAAAADCTVLVVRYRKVTRDTLRAALRNLELVNGTVAGVVLNALPGRLAEGRRGLRAKFPAAANARPPAPELPAGTQAGKPVASASRRP